MACDASWIYALTEPLTDEIRYVGITRDVAARYRNHLACGSSANKELRDWLIDLFGERLAPGLRVLANVPFGDNHDGIEASWIRRMHEDGNRLFNHVHIIPRKAGVEAFQKHSHAALIRKAIDTLGWNVGYEEISQHVGEVIHCLEGHNRVWCRGQWRTVDPMVPALLPTSYVCRIRALYRKALRKSAESIP